MRIPLQVVLPEIQQSFREVWKALDPFLTGNRDLDGRKFTNVGDAASEREWITLGQADRRYEPIKPPETGRPKRIEIKAVRIGLYANRGPAWAFRYTIFEASDRNYIAWVSDGANWLYAYGAHSRTQTQVAALGPGTELGTNDTGYLVWVTDYEHLLRWTGTAFVFAPGDPGSGWVAIGRPGGGVPNGGVWGLCDGSTYNVLNADGALQSNVTQNLTGDVFIKGGTAGSQQAAARATWEATAKTDNASPTANNNSTGISIANHGITAVQSGAGQDVVNTSNHVITDPGHTHSISAFSHNLSDANAQLKVPSEANGGLPLRIACAFYIRR